LKIHIVTAWYQPFIHPRAHRWTILAEYWAAQGHEVHVVTARHRECPDEATVNGVQVHRAGFDSLKEVAYYFFGSKNARGRVGAGVQKPGVFTRLTAFFYNVFWKKIYFPDDACLWYFPAKRKARQLLEREKFDALITVSLPFTGHLIGLALTRVLTWGWFKRIARDFCPKYYSNSPRRRGGAEDIPWLADIGDPFSLQAKSLNNSFLYGKISRRLEQKILENADFATVTTAFTLKKYCSEFGQKAVAKMCVIPPLLHPPHPPHPPQTPQTLKIGYFGALYAPVRAPDAFLDLLEKTFVLRPDLTGKIEVHFYGEIFPEFFKKLAAQPAIRLHGLRPREEVQAAMREADILLNIGNTTDFQLPSKAVEYLAAGKPILNLSYTDDDPFAAFFGDNDLIFNLKIKNGKVGEEDLRRWLVWLEGEKTWPNEAELGKMVAPYRVEAIAKNYLDLLEKPSASRMS
jgi:glycosyltransferase involved in cell wall biosynthesis